LIQIDCTDSAVREMDKWLADNRSFLKLAYDAEGCGCAVDGVAQLWLVDVPGPQDKFCENSPIPLLYDTRTEIFFEDRLKLDYRINQKAFVLSSDSQIYHHGMSIIDKR